MGTTLFRMARRNIQRDIVLCLACMSFVFAGIAFADAPAVASFTANPQTLPNDYSTALSWNISNSAGQSLYFTCPLGVTVKKADGTSVPCNTRNVISGTSADWAGFILTNVSGATQNVLVTLYPKDTTGANYDQAAARLTLSVQTSPQPIIDFSISTTTVASGAPITLTWKGVDASGANMQFECADSVRISTSASATSVLPCGRPALTADLPISSSLIVYPINSSRDPVSVTVHIFPAIGGSTYDATHSLSASFSVRGTPPPANPSASAFTSSLTRLMPNDSFTLSWTTSDSAGANIQFQCQDGLAVFAASSTNTSKLPCGTPAFTAPLAAKGTVTLSVRNTNSYSTNLSLILLPQDAKGVYFQTTSLALNLPVLPIGTVSPTSQAPSVSAVSPAAAPQTSNAPAKASAKKYSFTLTLKRGSRNADVTALQNLLMQYPDIYPGGLASGYFGPATEKALGLFQEKYGIARKGDVGYGTAGPKTRIKLNSIQ